MIVIKDEQKGEGTLSNHIFSFSRFENSIRIRSVLYKIILNYLEKR